MVNRTVRPYVCAQCASRLLFPNPSRSTIYSRRTFATKSADPSTAKTDEAHNAINDASSSGTAPDPAEPGPMSRRLQEATEEAMFTGGRAGQRAVEDAGFSDELKERLLAKLKDAQFRSENASAFSEINMPSSAGQGTRIIATSQPWTGEESTNDAVLRMLTDAHKPLKRELRGRPKIPDFQPVDTRIRQSPKVNPGQRIATARDKASIYVGSGMKDSGGLSEQERANLREELRERFQPGARALPNTLAGLASLANQRIEDAIARGQFKHIPRGKDVESDARNDNPFIDTTEYIMNKMIKRQDLVPPWIEKQQELAKAANAFRSRLRSDWKRHAARMIASKGGSLEVQMERARQFAEAEKLHNPRKRNVDQMAVPTNSTDDAVMVSIRQQTGSTSSNTEAPPEADGGTLESNAALPPPFRDPDWVKIEQSYMDLSISNINTITRSYNLMAPELARKPYFNLERELNNCYADVAPLLAQAIKDRISRPARPLVSTSTEKPGILDRIGGGTPVKVHESKAPKYGFKEWWRDVFSRSGN